jgi:hypothetical protein
MSENNPGNAAKKMLRDFCKWVCGWTILERAREWMKVHPWWAAAHIVNFLFAIVLWIKNGDIPILSIVIFMCIIFVKIYTEPIQAVFAEADQETRKEIEEARSQQRNKWMIFAYSFMLISLLLTVYPFTKPLFSSTQNASSKPAQGAPVKSEPGDTNSYLDKLRERPIAVFVGCTLDSKAENLRCNPKENTGGAVQESDKGRGALINPANEMNHEAHGTQQPRPIDTIGEGVGQPAPPPGNQSGNKNLSQSTQPGVGYAWAINIGGHVEGCSLDSDDKYGKSVTCEVKDGLLIPLYFIIMALMGGSISLTRRLPELQKQAGSEHIATEQQPKLSQYEFREYLIFHMVQFISAPFLAILAYYLIEPGSTANAVVLAFTAGFASETILLMVRSVANKITPQISEVPQYGAIAGIVKIDPDDAKDGNRKAIEVFLTELPHQAHAVADSDGFYTLNGVPVGEHSLSVNDINRGEILATGIVKVTHAQAVAKKNFDIPKQKPKGVSV